MARLFGFVRGQGVAVEVSAQTADRFLIARLKLYFTVNQLLGAIQDRLGFGQKMDEPQILRCLGDLEKEYGLEHVEIPDFRFPDE